MSGSRHRARQRWLLGRAAMPAEARAAPARWRRGCRDGRDLGGARAGGRWGGAGEAPAAMGGSESSADPRSAERAHALCCCAPTALPLQREVGGERGVRRGCACVRGATCAGAARRARGGARMREVRAGAAWARSRRAPVCWVLRGPGAEARPQQRGDAAGAALAGRGPVARRHGPSRFPRAAPPGVPWPPSTRAALRRHAARTACKHSARPRAGSAAEGRSAQARTRGRRCGIQKRQRRVRGGASALAQRVQHGCCWPGRDGPTRSQVLATPKLRLSRRRRWCWATP